MALGYGNWTFTSTGSKLIELALMEVPTADLEFLTRSGASLDKDDLAAHYLSEAEREARDEHRGYGYDTVDVTVSANSRALSISSLSDMQGANVECLFLKDANHPENGRPIPIYPVDEGDQIYGQAANDITSEFPSFAYWARDGQSIQLASKVPTATEFTVLYWRGPTVFTKANTASATSTVPDPHTDVVYLRLAMKFSDLLGMNGRVSALAAKREAADERLTRAFKGPDVLRHNEHYTYGFPQQIAQDRFAHIARY